MKKFKLHNYGAGKIFWTYQDENNSTKTISFEEFNNEIEKRLQISQKLYDEARRISDKLSNSCFTIRKNNI